MIFDAGVDELVARVLGGVGRDREHADDDVSLAHDLLRASSSELTVTPPTRCPIFVGVVVEDGGDR